MKKYGLIGLIVIGICSNGFCTEKLINIVHFESVDTAKALLSQQDKFTDSWSQMDIDFRMQKANSTKAELLKFIPTQAREWSINEKNILLSVLDSIDTDIDTQGFNIDFPQKLFLVKTTLNEEMPDATGYTRANYIVFNGDKITETNSMLKLVVAHELFHILTRHNPAFKKKMYKIIGFNLIDEIPYPQNLIDSKLTNPDAPYNDSYISLLVKDQLINCTMIIYSDRKYSGGDIFDYLHIGFLKLKDPENKEVCYVNGEPVIYHQNEISNFFEQIGRNTEYIVQPEEILADNFAFTILGLEGLPNPEIIDAIKKILKE